MSQPPTTSVIGTGAWRMAASPPTNGHDKTTSAANSGWFIYALLSAFFAALTAIFAKVGIAGVNSDMATLIRTVVILGVLSVFVCATDKWMDPFALSTKTWTFLVLSGLATGASWTCYFRALKVGEASKVAPVDKLSLVLVATRPSGLGPFATPTMSPSR